MVDCQDYKDNVREESPEYVPDTKKINSELGEHLQISHVDLLICEGSIPAFILATKRWVFCDVTKLSPVEYNQEAFSKLILPPETKTMLAALVSPQDGQESQFDDLIVGKGKGLVILLHGLPGVGKTFTAGELLSSVIP